MPKDSKRNKAYQAEAAEGKDAASKEKNDLLNNLKKGLLMSTYRNSPTDSVVSGTQASQQQI